MDVGRNEDGTIAKGFSLNPKGRPKGGVGGRCRALGLLDGILSEAECEKSLEKALREALLKRPLWFFVNIVMPLLPKETKGVLESGDRIVEWRGLLSTGAGSSAGQPLPGRDPFVSFLPGAPGDAGYLPVRGAAPAAEALRSPETPPF